MRWSEQQLEAHLKAHRNKAERSKLRLKTENDAKVQQARKNIVQAKSELNTEYDENQVLFCDDDEQFDELIVKRGAIVKGGLIRLKVWEL